MKFRFLGTGTSIGVPRIGCDCPVCTSGDPRDRRRRCGAYVSDGDTGLLIDTPPELREACVEWGVTKVKAVCLTHAHMDHVAGFDDVRRFNTLNGTWVDCAPDSPGANGRTCKVIGAVMDCYALPETIVQMHAIFPYVGLKPNEKGLFRPQIAFRDEPRFAVGSIRVERLAVEHGFPCCGYLLTGSDGHRLGYVSDCHELPRETLAALKGVEVMVLNCLRERPHPTHLNLSAALAYLGEIAPARAYLTHLDHDFTMDQWQAKLPAGVMAAHDGLEVEV